MDSENLKVLLITTTSICLTIVVCVFLITRCASIGIRETAQTERTTGKDCYWIDRRVICNESKK